MKKTFDYFVSDNADWRYRARHGHASFFRHSIHD